MGKNFSFIKTSDEINAMRSIDGGWFYNQEKLQIAWQISQNTYEKLLPPGLDPVAPIVYCFIGSFLRPATLYPYSEGGLYIIGSHNGRVGAYCLSMPVDGNDQGIDSGREFYGYPKKAAKIKLARRGDRVEGYIERNDVRFFEVSADLGSFNVAAEEAYHYIKNVKPGEKYQEGAYIINADWRIFSDQLCIRDVKLIWQKNNVEILSQVPAKVELKLRASEDDPWIELNPTRIIGGEFTTFNTQMLNCDIVKEYSDNEIETLLPYMFNKWDTWLFGKIHSSY